MHPFGRNPGHTSVRKPGGHAALQLGAERREPLKKRGIELDCDE
jgi:hypothetical protein